MRYMPIILLIGIICNLLCIVVFRLKLDRKYSAEFKALSTSLQSDLVSFSSDALSRIDNYFLSNKVSRASSPRSDVSPSDILFLDSGDYDYYYYSVGGAPVARVGCCDFYIGSSFPRGGRITAIYPDYLVVDDSLSFRNRSFVPFLSYSRSSSRPSETVEDSAVDVRQYQPPKDFKNVGSIDTMRK